MDPLAYRLIQVCMLGALAVVPVFIGVYSSRVFEPDKTALLRFLALMIVAAIALGRWLKPVPGKTKGAGMTPPTPVWWRRLSPHPLVMPVLAYLACLVISTVLTISHGSLGWFSYNLSFWGAYDRFQGTLTILAVSVFFWGARLVVRPNGRFLPLVRGTIVLAMMTTAGYGILQHLQLDPFNWAGGAAQRVGSTFGNPIFFGAYLAMVIPLLVADIVYSWLTTTSRRYILSAHGLVSAAILGTAVAGLIFTKSRGPLLALLAGIFMAGIALARVLQKKKIIGLVLGLFILIMTGLAVINVVPSFQEDFAQSPLLSRLTKLVDPNYDWNRVRILIWRGVLAAMADHPARILVGFGPESMKYVSFNYYQPELIQLEATQALPDRSHNAMFDIFFETGLLGLAAFLALIGHFYYFVFKFLGLEREDRTPRVFGTVFGAGIAAGIFIPLIIWGNLVFAGVGIVLGLLAAVSGYLIYLSLTRQSPGSTPVDLEAKFWVLVALAMVTSHLVETAVGISVITTKLMFWLSLGLVSALAGRSARSAAEPLPQPLSDANMSLLAGLPVGMVLFTLSMSFGDYLWIQGPLSLVMVLWGAGVVLLGGWYQFMTIAAEGTSRGIRLTPAHLGRFLVVALAPVLIYGLVRAEQPDQDTMWAFYCGMLAVSLLVAAGVLVGWRHFIDALNMWRAPVIGLVAFMIFRVISFCPVKADIYYKQALNAESTGNTNKALVDMQKAMVHYDATGNYPIALSRLYVKKSNETSNQQTKDELYRQALKEVEAVTDFSPYNVDLYLSSARIYQFWAQVSPDKKQSRERYLASADQFQKASQVAKAPFIYEEWGYSCAAAGQAEQALELYRKAITLNPKSYRGNLYVGALLLARDKPTEALEWGTKALELGPREWNSHLLMGDIQYQLNHKPEALREYQQALALNRNDFWVLRKLVLLHKELGQKPEAVDLAVNAATHFKGEQKAFFDSIIKEIQEGQR
ncbi:MAG: O-antigen ligase family protein [Deltaproteobacteria bacterium]|nr:O-antigen ligase family protein [Deltaproteobacteria bacterium]